MSSSHERQVTIIALVTVLPALVLAFVLLWTGNIATRTQLTLTVVISIVFLGGVVSLRERVIRPLQTLSNMIAAIREQDYSLQARHANADDALGLAMLEMNTLMTELKERRLGALEATALLQRVMAEIDVAVLAFDDAGALRLVNAGGERLLGQPSERLLGRRADELGLDACLEGDAPRVMELALGDQRGRYEMRRGLFRQGGRPHQFVVLADVSRALREEERLAWQRLIRVLGHEMNNSLTPINSLADRLNTLLQRSPPEGELREDLQRGLSVIANRSEGLTRFLASYTKLAKLPPPTFASVNVATWVQRATRLEARLPVEIVPSEDVVLQADGDQLDQLLINLLANAVDAANTTGGGVRVRWMTRADVFELAVQDDGPGLPDSESVRPFLYDEAGGTGIGLVLSRQIAEAHAGTLVLANRVGARGCEARLTLPLRS